MTKYKIGEMVTQTQDNFARKGEHVLLIDFIEDCEDGYPYEVYHPKHGYWYITEEMIASVGHTTTN